MLVAVILGIYSAIGFLFALAFVTLAVPRTAGWAVRLILIPGSAALWPLLLPLWKRGQIA